MDPGEACRTRGRNPAGHCLADDDWHARRRPSTGGWSDKLSEPDPQLLAPYVPDDFDDFWTEAVAEAESAPLDYKRSGSADTLHKGFLIEALTFRGGHGETRNGWIAAPKGAYRLPSFLWIAPYGRWSMAPDEYGTREGMVSLSFNFFGESAFHQESYTPARGYFKEGASSPQTFVFKTMFQNALIATRVLEAQPEVNELKIGTMGLSQGGGMAVWLGALDKRVRAVVADFPFLSGMRWVLAHRIHRYPLKELTDYADSIPLGREKVLNTLAYFDTVNMATRCEVPCLVSAGLKDPAVKPAQARAVFDALAGEKEFVDLDFGHDWHPSMIERNREWLLRWMDQ
jgi:cephalosporin-C deacetylase